MADHWDVRDGIDVTFETKKTYDISGLGELYNYLAHMCKDMPGVTFKGVSMWNTGFMLMQVREGVCLYLEKAFWDSEGSRELFKKFLSSYIPSFD